jgi:very-short-patch-repair endonuclease
MNDLQKNHVQELRKNTSLAEQRLWHHLRAKRLSGHKFRRQHLIYPYIALQSEYDARRTIFLESKGYRVLRFWNNVVFRELNGVLHAILDALNSEHPASSP